MNRFLGSLFAAFALSCTGAHAQFFATGDLSNDGTNIENGTLFEAVNISYSGTDSTIDGVTFTSFGGTPDSGTNFTLSNNVLDGGTNGFVPSDAAIYPLVNQGAVNTSTRSMTLTLTNLNPGTTYSAQLIFDTGDSSGRSASLTDNGLTSDSVTAGVSGGAVYITETFTASTTSEAILINDATATGGRTPLNLSAFVVDAVPEPTTWAMLILGFVGLAFVQRARLSSRL